MRIRSDFTCREGAASRRALMAVQSEKGYVHVFVYRKPKNACTAQLPLLKV